MKRAVVVPLQKKMEEAETKRRSCSSQLTRRKATTEERGRQPQIPVRYCFPQSRLH
jgi:hypothetical protein